MNQEITKIYNYILFIYYQEVSTHQTYSKYREQQNELEV